MLKAGSLYYAVFISFLLILILFALFLLVKFQSIYVGGYINHEQVKANTRSGIAIYNEKPSKISYGQNTTINLFNDGINKVKLLKKRWGFFDMVFSESQLKENHYLKIGLTGNRYELENRISLYIPDKDKFLSLAGNTVIKGKCYLPKRGVKKTTVEGKGFGRNRLVEGEIEKSDNSLPSIDKNRIEFIQKYIEGDFEQNDTVIPVENLLKLKDVNRSFQESTIIFYIKNLPILTNISLQNNVIVFSEQSLKIENSCKLNGCILIASSIIFNNNFSGECQAFAKDSMSVGRNCNFKYPSVLGVINPTNSNTGCYVGEESKIEGGIILYQEKKSIKAPELKISKTSQVHGIVYCSGNIEHSGRIEGSVYCDGFILKTKNSFYENLLLNAAIDVMALSDYYVAPVFFNEINAKKNVIKSLK